jgi:hypothetical protein
VPYSYAASASMELAASGRLPPAAQAPRDEQAARQPDPPPAFRPAAEEPRASPAPAIDIRRLTEEVYQAIERKLRIERQRKGF